MIKICGFCLNEFETTKTFRSTIQCPTCRNRHERSKNNKIKSDNPINTFISKYNIGPKASSAKGHREKKFKALMAQPVVLGW